MDLNKEYSNKININFSKRFLIYAASNLSLYLAGCFINKHKIKNYKIIFSGQGGKRNKKKEDLEFICKKINIDVASCLLISDDLNYDYLKMFFYKNKLDKRINKFNNTTNINYITSFNYGLINSFLINKYKKNNDYLILEDGIDNWISVKNKFPITKSFLYSITLRKFIKVKKFRKNKYDILITSLNNKKIYNSNNIIDISDQFKKLVSIFQKENIIGVKSQFNILIICARTVRYNKGLKRFLLHIKDNIFSKNKFLNNENTTFYFKLHPGYTTEDIKIKLEKFIMIKDDNIPIEFFDLTLVKQIITPVNTSAIYINQLSQIKNQIINYYDIGQSDFKNKKNLIESFDIKELDNGNYRY